MSIVFGCIAPHPPLIVQGIGAEEDKKPVEKTINAMGDLAKALADARPESAVLCSPHSYYIDPSYMGISTVSVSEGNLHEWGTLVPAKRFENDLELVRLIEEEARAADIPIKTLGNKGYNLDHGVLVPIQFLDPALKTAKLVPVTFSYLPLKTHFAYGQAIGRAAAKAERRVAFIASGDLSHYLKGSHYGYHAEGAVFEELLEKALLEMDAKAILGMDPQIIERAGECGLRSIVIMMGTLDGLKVKPKIYSHEGPFGVGYMIASFQVK
jgi:MEMO1 family protein